MEQPQRYAVERTFAWLGRYRRQSRDYERSSGSSEAMIKISSIHRMLKLLRKDCSMKPVPFKYRELPQKVDTVARKSGLLPHAARAWCRLWVVSARPSP